jgi:hypothetical protein
MKNKLRNLAIVVSIVIASIAFSQNTFAQMLKNPLIEFCTGTWCQWCPCGDITIENLLAVHPNLIPLAYHGPAGQDPYSIFPGNEIIGLMGFSGYPTATVPPGLQRLIHRLMNPRLYQLIFKNHLIK